MGRWGGTKMALGGGGIDVVLFYVIIIINDGISEGRVWQYLGGGN